MTETTRAPRRSKETKRLTKTDWLEAGLAVLGQKGAGGVRIDAICKKLGVTKGSFYWHFQDREDLMTSVMEYWEENATVGMIDRVESTIPHPWDCLWHVVDAVVLGDYNVAIEVAVRHWAHEEPSIRARLESIDGQRLGFFRRQFERLEFAPQDADLRAHTLYSITLVREFMHTGETREALTHRMRASVDLLTRKGC